MRALDEQSHAPSGIPALPSITWGSHIGQLFGSGADLHDTLVPYFRAGLENNERCLWVTDAPFSADEARAALRAVVPDLESREACGQIEIQDSAAFYKNGEPFRPAALVAGLVQRERDAVSAGYRGLRTNGNCAWVGQTHWNAFLDYESQVQDAVRGRRLICMCSYRHDAIDGDETRDVLDRHHLVLRNTRSSQPRTALCDANAPGIARLPQETRIGEPIGDFQEDVDAIQAIAAVPTILQVICRTTGMGFAAIARVTPQRWVCLAVHDEIGFGLKPGGELSVATTLCHEVRQARDVVAIDHVAEDARYRHHHTPARYGFQSYISMPVFLRDGSFYGTLCAIDPKPAKVTDPAVIGMFRMFSDLIAYHIEAEKHLAKAQADLSDARLVNGLREQFIAVLGHDLRNPMAAISAGATLLRMSGLGERERAISDAISRSATHMTALIDDISDLTRVRLGSGITLRRTREGLEPALQHAVEEMRLAYPRRRIETAISLAHPVEADPVYVARLLSNLLKNALIYGSQTEPVSVTISADDDFVLSVSNAGPPIADSLKAGVFSPFTRGAGPDDHPGLGLGLFIVAEIARAHGGSIDLTSTDHATTFTFRMPLAIDR
ncbi:histidine kinase [Caballeronia temeraria]|uniref:histidine kinase n=1 Tax=Caballeronia temeraria TaxID=1777137 RepID=A0A157ZUI6_9BURK|nr:MEDS domain-containing protein [Caballeronia temeraria]SAK49171.1 histidine kinase [Caballeronia temeraria]